MYSTAAEVIEYTGVRPEDLSKSDEQELITLIDGWLEEIKDIIDQDRRRNFLSEAGDDPTAVRPMVHNIAKRMAANTVALAVLRRDTPIIQLNDFSVQLVEDKVLTKDIRRDLALIPRGQTDVTPVRIRRMRSQTEIDEAEAS